jgi:hypothetical protein
MIGPIRRRLNDPGQPAHVAGGCRFATQDPVLPPSSPLARGDVFDVGNNAVGANSVRIAERMSG